MPINLWVCEISIELVMRDSAAAFSDVIDLVEVGIIDAGQMNALMPRAQPYPPRWQHANAQGFKS